MKTTDKYLRKTMVIFVRLMKHLTAKDFKTTNWSGGTTTELFIWPETGSYSNRNFDFRLSTATVEVEESVFTPLSGVARTLMVLAGEMELIHEGQHSKRLGPFDQDHFQGGWTTNSVGKCSDFNLMCQGKTKGELEHLALVKGSEKKIDLYGEINLIYAVKGVISSEGRIISEGELLVVENQYITAGEDCDIILVRIKELS